MKKQLFVLAMVPMLLLAACSDDAEEKKVVKDETKAEETVTKPESKPKVVTEEETNTTTQPEESVQNEPTVGEAVAEEPVTTTPSTDSSNSSLDSAAIKLNSYVGEWVLENNKNGKTTLFVDKSPEYDAAHYIISISDGFNVTGFEAAFQPNGIGYATLPDGEEIMVYFQNFPNDASDPYVKILDSANNSTVYVRK